MFWSPRHVAPLLCVAGSLLWVSGCAGPEIKSPPPRMPTVSAAPSSARVPGPSEQELLAAVLPLARTGDVAGAWRQLARGDSPRVREAVALQVANSLADESPARAVEFAASMPAGMPRGQALETAARAYARREPDAALQWALGIRDVEVAALGRRVVAEERVAADGRGAAERIAELPASVARDEVLGFAVAAWARREPDAALNWTRNVADEALRRRLTSTAAFAIAQKDPGRAQALADNLPAGRDRWLLISAIGQSWVARDPKAAMAWANQLPAGEPREAAFAGIDTGLGVPSSRRLARGPTLRGGGARGSARAPADEVGAGDTPAFAAWRASQAAQLSRDEAIVEYVRQRGAAEPAAVGQWLSTLPGGPARDRALEIYVESVLPTAPQQAADVLRTLPRSDVSDAWVERTARQLLITNPPAAEALLRESRLPPDRQEQLRREAGR